MPPARRRTFIPEPSRAGRYDTQAAYKFPCENPRQAFSQSAHDRAGDGGRTGHGWGARPARQCPASQARGAQAPSLTNSPSVRFSSARSCTTSSGWTARRMALGAPDQPRRHHRARPSPVRHVPERGRAAGHAEHRRQHRQHPRRVHASAAGAVNQWDVAGKCDGLTADPMTGKVIATINEDANSSLDTITVATGRLQHYRYSEPLPHNGGTDAISIYHGQILISASAPGHDRSGRAAADLPGHLRDHAAPEDRDRPGPPALLRRGPGEGRQRPGRGKLVRLALTDPDSNSRPVVVAAVRGRLHADLSGRQGADLRTSRTGGRASLDVLSLSNSVDDTAWADRSSRGLVHDRPDHRHG